MSTFFRRLFSSAPPVNMSQAKDTVQKYIDENRVIVFSKSYCPYCRQAKSALDSLRTAYEAIELDQRDDGAALQDALQQISGQRTVPNIYIGQKHIGGNSDLQTLLSTDKLEPLLQEVGAIKA
ncbi:glutaredoxin-C2 [Plectosphaerella plurivora]|uniref:Glutaredoxin-C2 n=1 Tax=Plectosphaerella plurivora TaxID=936078 RepID=A0A9P8UYH2_9PEZI|nr:glutaredoxin-C2 [Plectosphaerella plurivora]